MDDAPRLCRLLVLRVPALDGSRWICARPVPWNPRTDLVRELAVFLLPHSQRRKGFLLADLKKSRGILLPLALFFSR